MKKARKVPKAKKRKPAPAKAKAARKKRQPAAKPALRKLSRKLTLSIDLVPESSWYQDVRKIFTPEEWRIVKAKALVENKHRCSVCGSATDLQCDALWDYDDRKHVQKLVGLTILCTPCHLARRFDQAEALAERGRVNLDKVIEHFLRINRCRRSTFEVHRKEVLARRRRRSKHEWKVDLQWKIGALEAPAAKDRLSADWLDKQISSNERIRRRTDKDSRKVEKWVKRQGVDR